MAGGGAIIGWAACWIGLSAGTVTLAAIVGGILSCVYGWVTFRVEKRKTSRWLEENYPQGGRAARTAKGRGRTKPGQPSNDLNR